MCRLSHGTDDHVVITGKAVMDIALMGKRTGFYEAARREAIRRTVEKTLVCPACGRRNQPGNVAIDVDEHDDATCPCGEIFQVRVDYDGV
jgi:hypothetical protein